VKRTSIVIINIAALMSLVWTVWLVVSNAHLIDDAFMIFRTIDNFWNGNGLVFNPGYRVQVFTSPLWTLLLLVMPIQLLSPPIFSLALSFTIFLLFLIIATKLFAKTPNILILFLLCFCTSSTLIAFTTSGLETGLIHFLILLYFFFKSSKKYSHTILQYWCLGFLLMTRHDLVLVVLPLVAFSVLRDKRFQSVSFQSLKEGIITVLIPTFVPVLYWSIFSYCYYGSIIPNTAVAKMSLLPSLPIRLYQTKLYLLDAFQTDPILVIAPILAILVSILKKTWKVFYTVLASTVITILYLMYIGGDFMTGRFLTAICLTSILLLITEFKKSASITTLLFVSALACCVFKTPGLPSNANSLVKKNGLANEGAYYFQAYGLPNLAKIYIDHEYPFEVARGIVIKNSKDPVTLIDTLGISGYFAGSKKIILDIWGLADPVIARMPSAFNVEKDFRPGHVTRKINQSYIDLLTRRQNILDRAIQ
jgi:arabinofuranosyltransferase